MRPRKPELRLSCGQRLGIGWARHGQAEHENRATLWFVLARDLSVMILHDAIHGAQSQPRAFADGLCSIERIEHAMRLFYARPAIGKLHRYIFSRMLCADLKQPSACFLERIQSIFDDLDEGLEQLVAVAPDFRKVRLDQGFDVDFLIVPLEFTHLHAPLQKHA